MGRSGVLLTSNLPQLQNLIKRDPVAYKEEFLQQWNHYDSIRQMFKINPEEQAHHFKEIVAFISQVRLNKSIIHLYIKKNGSGCNLLSERDSGVSCSNIYIVAGKLWYFSSRYPQDSFTELGYATK
jgi:hypothetical protein